MNVVLASNNKGKINEFKKVLLNSPLELIPQAELGVEDIAETGLTFIENALIKARHASAITGLPAIADDSGLAVAALANAPGIYSARYAGEKANATDNIKKLLTNLTDIPDDQRQAYFYCVLIYLSHPNDPTPLIATGKWSGTILHEPRGTLGFGYDPIFYLPDRKQTAAELSPDIKNKISHRGIALQALMNLLQDKK